ncbi:hypothetical protein [Isoptericola dokdonensis]|uniref:Uncharacterized protein n=1 Tax=Isoptericola dokdonensis DS-3 TaxID=1300344 RepID=A0A168F3E6_9MICO|nr:hypothetical protein [Isoptericola dokdonensis]ANC30846.1 hypothetical protein I598_1286 [Isoptericola dokdonensis DS-3]
MSTTTDTTTDASTRWTVLDGPDALACGWCGIAVPEPGERPAWTIEEAPTIAGFREDSPVRAGARHTFTRCDQCAQRRAEAGAISQPEASRWHRRYGSSAAAFDAAEAVLAALDMLGRPRAEAHAPDAAVTLAGLVAGGTALRWSGWFMPRRAAGVPLRGATTAPWAHIEREDPDGAVAALRDAYGAVLRRRVAARVPASTTHAAVPAPVTLAGHWALPDRHLAALGGCLLCGVASAVPPASVPGHRLLTPAARLAATWHPATCNPQSLGGHRSLRTSGRRAAGFLCPPCHDAAARVGDGDTVDAAARDAALAAWLREHQPEDVAGLRVGGTDPAFDQRRTPAWAVLATWDTLRGVTRHGNVTPWAHLR